MSGTKTWFEGLPRTWADVPIKDGKISTPEFLEAAEGLVTLFDVLGSAKFAIIKSDINGNIKKVRDRYLAAPAESATLQDLVVNELKTGSYTATEGLLWLTRTLDFTNQGVKKNLAMRSEKAGEENDIRKGEELSASFRAAYQDTLKPYHGFLAKGAFTTAMSAVPYRADFYMRLCSGDESRLEDVKVQAADWVKALEELLNVLQAFMKSPEAQWKK